MPLPGRVRRLSIAAGTGYLVAVALVVFWPEHVDSCLGPLYRVLAHAVPAAFPFGVETTLNVVLFVPFGVILSATLPGRPFVILGLAWVVPLLIEIAQGVFLAGRTSSAIDVAANTVGGVLGAMGVSATRRLSRRLSRSRR